MSDPRGGPTATLLAGGRVVTPDGIHDDVWVHVDGDVIAAVDDRRPAVDAPVVDLQGAWLAPGFVDLHVHGGGGHDVAASAEAMAGAVAFHRGHGTTATLVSLVTAPVADLREQLRWAAALTRRGPVAEGCVLGSHLEGPFLAAARCGAQNPVHMIAPEPAVVDDLVAAGDGALRMVTLAPELDGALELVGRLGRDGIVAALGHSDATYAQALAAIDAGASHATHLGNGMAPLHHREPGLVGAALARGLTCELIADGRHLHPVVVALVSRATDAVLVTDAVDAAGAPEGRYELGGQAVVVSGGEARLESTGALAGSLLTMDAALRHAVLDAGLTIERASRAASGTPARVIGVDDRLGAIAPGLRADLVVLGDDLRLREVMAAGVWCDGDR